MMTLKGPHTKGKATPRAVKSREIIRLNGTVTLVLADYVGTLTELVMTDEEARRLGCALYGPEVEGKP